MVTIPVTILFVPYVLVAIVLWIFGRFVNPDGSEWSELDKAIGCAFWPVTLTVALATWIARR